MILFKYCYTFNEYGNYKFIVLKQLLEIFYKYVKLLYFCTREFPIYSNKLN